MSLSFLNSIPFFSLLYQLLRPLSLLFFLRRYPFVPSRWVSISSLVIRFRPVVHNRDWTSLSTAAPLDARSEGFDSPLIPPSCCGAPLNFIHSVLHEWLPSVTASPIPTEGDQYVVVNARLCSKWEFLIFSPRRVAINELNNSLTKLLNQRRTKTFLGFSIRPLSSTKCPWCPGVWIVPPNFRLPQLLEQHF